MTRAALVLLTCGALVAALLTGCINQTPPTSQSASVPSREEIDAALVQVRAAVGSEDSSFGIEPKEATAAVAGRPIGYWTLWEYDPARQGVFDQMKADNAGVYVPLLVDGSVAGLFRMQQVEGKWSYAGSVSREEMRYLPAVHAIVARLGVGADIRRVGCAYNLVIMGRSGDKVLAVFPDAKPWHASPSGFTGVDPEPDVIYQGSELQAFLAQLAK